MSIQTVDNVLETDTYKHPNCQTMDLNKDPFILFSIAQYEKRIFLIDNTIEHTSGNIINIYT